MKRPVEERRRLLKGLLAGGAAATAATVLPDGWKKPIVDSVIVPVHAQGSAPTFIQSISVAYSIDSNTGAPSVTGSVTPANSPRTHLFNNPLDTYDYVFTPTVTVTPGITDEFTMTVNETVVGGNATNFTPATQTFAPNLNTGLIPFGQITGDVDDAQFVTYQITITPSNPAYQTYYLQVTLDEEPAGSGAGLGGGAGG